MKKETATRNVEIVKNANFMIRELRKGKEIHDVKSGKEQENYEYAQLVVKAEKFVKEYIEKNGTKAFISERLRNGFIGDLVHTEAGTTYIQSVRGKPYGTVVAIKSGDDIVLGMSYMDTEDANKAHPIVGLYIALKRAIDGAKEGKKRAEVKYIKSRAKKQIRHFEKRALAYFHPDVYSYSRGQEGKKVVYENYEEIHRRRAMILGENK